MKAEYLIGLLKLRSSELARLAPIAAVMQFVAQIMKPCNCIWAESGTSLSL